MDIILVEGELDVNISIFRLCHTDDPKMTWQVFRYEASMIAYYFRSLFLSLILITPLGFS